MVNYFVNGDDLKYVNVRGIDFGVLWDGKMLERVEELKLFGL